MIVSYPAGAASCPAWAPLCNLKLACARRVFMPRHGNSWLKTPAQARCKTLGTLARMAEDGRGWQRMAEDGRGPPRFAWTQRRVKACFLNSIWLRVRFCCLKLALVGRGPSPQPRQNFAYLLTACEFFCCGACGCHVGTAEAAVGRRLQRPGWEGTSQDGSSARASANSSGRGRACLPGRRRPYREKWCPMRHVD